MTTLQDEELLDIMKKVAKYSPCHVWGTCRHCGSEEEALEAHQPYCLTFRARNWLRLNQEIF